MSFITHKYVHKSFFGLYFFVRPTFDDEEFPYSIGLWHPTITTKSIPSRYLTKEDISLLSDLSIYYKHEGSFPLRLLTENNHNLATCDLFPHFPSDEIGTILMIFFMIL